MPKLAYEISDSDNAAKEQAFYEALGIGDAFCNGEEVSHIISRQEGRLSLRLKASKAAPTVVDFLSPEMEYRIRTSGKKQGLARAVGLHRHAPPSVLDCTAGLGKEAFILASLGCRVTLLEKSALVHALLKDGLQRAAASGDRGIEEVIARMQLRHADARDWLATVQAGQQAIPEVVYLDPMFPTRKKSALVKKDMTALQQLLGPDDDVPGLLAQARQVALKRVVLKRPVGKIDIALPEPDFLVRGKTSQFAVYLVTGDLPEK